VERTELFAGVAAAALSAVHLGAGHLRFLGGVPRRWLLSAFSGVSIAYVAVHLLPEVAAGQEVLGAATDGGALRDLERHAWLLLLAGLVSFYALELVTRRARGETVDGDDDGARPERTTAGIYSLSIGSFAAYNVLVGYLLPERAGDGGALALFTLALGVHFVVNDFGLQDHHRDRYEHLGRWILATAVLVGWGLRLVGHVPTEVRAAMVAFLAGGIVLNVLKEELPEPRRSRIAPLVGGALAYSALLLIAE
jgi:hypothetical protein